MPPLSVPTTSALPPSQRVPPTSPAVFRILNRLSRSSLISLILDWLDDRNQLLSAPYLFDRQDEEDPADLYTPAESLDELRDYYSELQTRKGGKRDVVDRVIEGDWRNGLSLYQLAMADMQYLYDHPTSQKWTALKVVQLKNSEDGQENAPEESELPSLPRFHPSTFLQNLQREVLPDVKAHYNLDRPKSLPLSLLRIYILDSPYNTSLALSSSSSSSLDSSKTIYIGFPDASPPHLRFTYYLNWQRGLISGKYSIRNQKPSKILLDGLPKAFSRPRARYALQPTGLAARSLESLISMRGQGRTNAAGGGWGTYASDKRKDTPLNTQLPTPLAEKPVDDPSGCPNSVIIISKGLKRKMGDEVDKKVMKRRKLIAQARFGDSAMPNDGKGIERFDVRIEDPFPGIEPTAPGQEAIAPNGDLIDWAPNITVTFHGRHTFAGIRELVERGVVDGEKMPGWMTGEENISIGVVKEGRIQGFKGSAL